MPTHADQLALRTNTNPDGTPLSAADRETIMARYLPPPSSTPSSRSSSSSRSRSSDLHTGASISGSGVTSRKPVSTAPTTTTTTTTTTTSNMARRKPAPRARKSTPLRTMLKSNLHLLIYTLIHAIFGLYVRLRMAYHAIYDRLLAVLYYHHRTPDLIRNDVKALSRLPEHLSVVLTLHDNGDRDAALEELVNDVGELSAWCASAGIPLLSVYERTGILKSYIPQTHTAITRTLHAYFNPTPPSLPPSLSIRSPSHPSYSPPPSHPSSPSTPPIDADVPAPEAPHLNLLLLSATDGRNTIVDLTKTLADMSQRGKISPSDIGAELVDAEISESVMGEPDLLVVFGPRVVLEGYPPWQVRLTEIFHVPDNSEGVGYQVFLRALHRYAKAQMRFGR